MSGESLRAAIPRFPGRESLGQAARGTATMLRRPGAGRRPLPSFLIIGTQKGGTTSLYEYLCKHPAVTPPRTKEVHYFDLSYRRGAGWYRAHFDPPRRPGGITGEASPYYLFHPLVPERVARDLPSCRFVVSLRNPIDRTLSHYNHERALGHESLGFEQALEREGERLRGEEERILADLRYRPFAHQHFSYVQRGLYAEQLERWFRCFERERFLVLSAEELFADPGGTTRRTQEFLGLDPVPPADLAARNARSYSPIADDLRGRLRETFAPHNRRLSELVGRDFDWD